MPTGLLEGGAAPSEARSDRAGDPSEAPGWLLAQGRASLARNAALAAASAGSATAQTYLVLGRAEIAIGRPAAAEAALMKASALAPSDAEPWAALATARRLGGDRKGERAALDVALRLDPEHPSARAALVALNASEPDQLRLWAPDETRASLGLAVDYLSFKPAFRNLPFGLWTRTLAHQAQRRHQSFVLDRERRVLGFLGWALTDEARAREWAADERGLLDNECREGDCAIVNAWAADTGIVNQFLTDCARRRFADRRYLFFKRLYPDGRSRPVRLPLSRFRLSGGLASTVI